MSLISFDTETHPFARAWLAPRTVCVSWALGDALTERYLERWGRMFERVAAWLEGPDLIVAHNAPYDLCSMMATDARLIPLVFRKFARGEIHCTKTRQKLLDLALGRLEGDRTGNYDAGAVARVYGIEGVNKENPWRRLYDRLDGVEVADYPPEADAYARRDGSLPGEFWFAQQRCCDLWVASHGSPILHETAAQTETDFDLYLQSCWGVRTHRGRVEEVTRLVAHDTARMRAALQDRRTYAPVQGLEPEPLIRADDPGTPRRKPKLGTKDKKAAQRRLWAATATHPEVRKPTEAGERTAQERAKAEGRRAPRSDAQVFELLTEPERLQYLSIDSDACVLSGDPTLIQLCDYGSSANVLGACADLAEGYDLPLQASFDNLKDTGRTSSFRPKDPIKGKQLQNFPQSLTDDPSSPLAMLGLRECCIPRSRATGHYEDNGFISADYSSAEMHTLAQVCVWLFGRSRLAELLLSGTDPHLDFAVNTQAGPHKLTYAEAKAALKAGDKAWKKMRARAKPANFGYPGGMGPKKFVLYSRDSYGIIFTLAEATQIREQWLANLPEMGAYFEWVDRELHARPDHTIRQFVSNRWRGGPTFPAACNGFFQGLCADGAKAALRAVTRECFDPASALWGFRPWNFVHDELVLEGPLARCAEAAERLAEVMDREFNRYVPDVPTKAEPQIMMAWAKDAATIRDESGRLLPWDLHMRKAG